MIFRELLDQFRVERDITNVSSLDVSSFFICDTKTCYGVYSAKHGPLHIGRKLSWPKFLNLKC